MNSIKKIIKYVLLHTLVKLQYRYHYKRYRKQNQKQYILFGIPEHGNLGDHAIAIAEMKFLKDIGITEVFEVPIEKQKLIIKQIMKNTNENDIIMITGGGFIGDIWMKEEQMVREVISSFLKNKILIFPSTIFYRENNEGKIEFQKSLQIYSKHPQLVICAREKYTYEFIKKYYQNVKVLFVPDIVLYMYKYKDNKPQNREEILLCLRKDVEKKVSQNQVENIIEVLKCQNVKIRNTDTVIRKRVLKKERLKMLEEKLEEFSNSRLVITDRLHGMIFAAITETPCIAIGNYNYKVKGVYEWIKELNYINYEDNIESIEEEINGMLKNQLQKNHINLKKYFNDIAKELGG